MKLPLHPQEADCSLLSFEKRQKRTTLVLFQRYSAFSIASLVLITSSAVAQNATWIWYPGDYEVWLGNQVQTRRTDRGSFFPPFWKLDSHYALMNFSKKVHLAQEETVHLFVEGQYNVNLDNHLLTGYPTTFTIPAGDHSISLKVFNQEHVPAIYVQGKTIVSDSSWKVTYEDKEWIDQSGKVSDKSGTTFFPAASGGFNDPLQLPSSYKLPTSPKAAVRTESTPGGLLVDFGQETFGYVVLHGLKGKGKLSVYYGESKEEALSPEGCQTLDDLDIDQRRGDLQLTGSRAFRYVQVRADKGVSFDSVSMLYEYAPLANKGSFKCSDDEINKIWDVAAYTFHLATREFFLDGIKRDRWVWSGDAYQSYLMNYYLFNDNQTVTRTIYELRGKDPVTSHINTIMDYSFYWFNSVYDYYQYSGDAAFMKQIYPRMKSMMDYCLSRRNADGLMEGLAGDWVFIDWADGLSKKGEVSFEQMLFCRSLETMALCANLTGDEAGASQYSSLAADLRKKLFTYYWNESKGAMVHSRIDGKQTENVTRYANMFGIFFNYFNEAQKQSVKTHVLLNDNIQKITTPYMHFYELEALCAMGEQTYVLKQMKDYWGGMLLLGATSFWEEYDPAKKRPG